MTRQEYLIQVISAVTYAQWCLNLAETNVRAFEELEDVKTILRHTYDSLKGKEQRQKVKQFIQLIRQLNGGKNHGLVQS